MADSPVVSPAAPGDAATGRRWWHPDVMEPRREALRLRADIMRVIRQYFEACDLLEVETPALQLSPGIEPHLNAFVTTLTGPNPADSRVLHLHTSPEYAMKKLLVAGWPAIFQICHVFRNGEIGPVHHPEFTMLEWYRAEADTEDLMDDCAGLLQAIAGVMPDEALLRHGDSTCDPTAEPERLTVAEALARHAGVDLAPSLADPRRPDRDKLAAAADKAGIRTDPGDSWEDVFFRITTDLVEPKLGIGRPTFLTDYPISMAALSRAKPDDPALADRFELYLCGVEIANAFGELTDAEEQARRFEADQAARRARYGEAYPVDTDFLAALRHGMPPAAGIALGIDRLAQLAAGADDINHVLWAPVDPPA